MINFGAIKLEGFGSFVESTTFNLDREGLNIIRGKNGKGKTTLWSGLYFCLFGENLKGVTKTKLSTWKKLRPKGFKGTRTITMFSKGNDKYMVARHIKFKGTTKGYEGGDSLMLFKNGEYQCEGLHLADVQKNIEEILGMNSRLFINSILFGQRMVRLIQAKGEDKRKVFEDFFEMNFIPKAKDEAKSRLDEIVTESSSLAMNIESKTDKFQTLKSSYEDKKQIIEDFKEAKASRVEVKKYTLEAVVLGHKGLTAEVKKLEEKQGKVTGGDFNHTELKEARAAEKKEKGLLEAAEREHTKFYSDVLDGSKEIEKAESAIITIEDNIKTINKDCPTCKQDLPAAQVAGAIDELNKDIATERQVIKTVKASVKVAEAGEKKLKKQVEELILRVDANVLEVTRIEELEETYNTNKEEIDSLVYNINAKKATLESKTKDIAVKTQEYEEALKEKPPTYNLEEIKGNMKELATSVNTMEDKLEVLKVNRTDIDWWYKKGFGNSGLKSFIFDAMLEKVNTYIEHYASKLGTVVRFSVDLEKASKPFITEIQYQGQTVDYEEFSGGQQQRVDICLAFAMFDINCEGQEMNILILDEVLEGLDTEGIEQVFEILREKAENKSIYLITHLNNIDVHNAKDIEISFEDGTTKITAA